VDDPRFSHFSEQTRRVQERASRVYTFAASQPSWVTRIAAGAAALTLLAVFFALFLLIVPVVLIFLLVFLAAAGLASLRARLGRLFTGRDDAGRRNVRVIVRRQP